MRGRAYDPQAVEARWQRFWERERTNTPDLHRAQRPFTCLMMFPYPSAEGLHVGNVFAFTGVDIQGRFHRMLGHDVFEPIGFDAFGIHSENYAMRMGTHPLRLVPANIENFRRQMKRVGLMVDWTREVQTTDPSYYRWTQWIFLKLHERGLAYRGKAPVNWCPECMTVLADEQVIDGMCERHPGTAVVKREMEQWFFRITAYAQRLLDDLEWIDWSDAVRRAQIHWIGRREGAEIAFRVEGWEDRSGPERTIRVFTTRADTVYGATCVILAPEHPFVDALTVPLQREAVEAYRREAAARSEIERLEAGREKTGVFLGSYALNPATGRPVPIWISDYVLMAYGAGAIMAVPAHDARDFEFAHRFGLPLLPVVFPPGGVPPEHDAYEGEGTLRNSGPFDGMTSIEARAAITAHLERGGMGRAKVQYRLRDWCISRQRYWGPPIPMIDCDACGVVPVPESDLPVLLPAVEDFRPDANGVAPLARVREFLETACPRCGGPARRETDVSDNFLDSAWYFLRYPSTERADAAWDAGLTAKWLPVHLYIGGREHSVLHLMYARFLCMAFHDMGLLPFEEPFRRFRAHGTIVRDGAKMSKSRGNVVNQDAIVAAYGADSLRMVLMFMGPYEEGGDFRDAGIVGIRRFLDRVWRWVAEELPSLPRRDLPREAKIKLNQTIRKVTEDTAALQYNTAISALMELLHVIRAHPVADRDSGRAFVRLLAPYAPHLAEELWEILGGRPSVFDAGWPEYDPDLLRTEETRIAVQVDGRLREVIVVPRGIVREQAEAAARAAPRVAAHLEGRRIAKVVYVPDRLLNFVLG